MKPVNRKEQSQIVSPLSPRPRRKPPARAANWDQGKALELAKKGVGPSDIAGVIRVSRNTVRTYLQRAAPELEALGTFKDRLGDSLALTLAKCINLEDSLLDALNDEQVLATLTPAEKERLLGRLTIAKGVASPNRQEYQPQ